MPVKAEEYLGNSLLPPFLSVRNCSITFLLTADICFCHLESKELHCACWQNNSLKSYTPTIFFLKREREKFWGKTDILKAVCNGLLIGCASRRWNEDSCMKRCSMDLLSVYRNSIIVTKWSLEMLATASFQNQLHISRYSTAAIKLYQHIHDVIINCHSWIHIQYNYSAHSLTFYLKIASAVQP